MASVHKQCLDAIVTATQALTLTPALEAGEIVARRRPNPKNGNLYHGITFFMLQEQEAPGTNRREDIGYAIGGYLAVPVDNSQADGLDTIPSWREAIRREFIHQRLSGVSFADGHYLTTTFEPGSFLVPADERYEVSTFVIRCWMREPRT